MSFTAFAGGGILSLAAALTVIATLCWALYPGPGAPATTRTRPCRLVRGRQPAARRIRCPAGRRLAGGRRAGRRRLSRSSAAAAGARSWHCRGNGFCGLTGRSPTGWQRSMAARNAIRGRQSPSCPLPICPGCARTAPGPQLCSLTSPASTATKPIDSLTEPVPGGAPSGSGPAWCATPGGPPKPSGAGGPSATQPGADRAIRIYRSHRVRIPAEPPARCL